MKCRIETKTLYKYRTKVRLLKGKSGTISSDDTLFTWAEGAVIHDGKRNLSWSIHHDKVLLLDDGRRVPSSSIAYFSPIEKVESKTVKYHIRKSFFGGERWDLLDD